VPGLDVRVGQTIAGRYRIEELIGTGASGVVLSARSIQRRERVALKLFAAYTDGQEDLRQRRIEKAHVAAQLSGEHVAHIVEIGVTEDAMPFVATEWLEGSTLEAELADRERLPVPEAVRWVMEACEGLAEAHAIGLIHGDLKPQNLFLCEPKNTARRRTHPASSALSLEVTSDADLRVLKVLDFGTTSPLDAIGDQSASAFFGSPAFLAPEQIEGTHPIDARVDVWALGVLLHDAIAGSLPFEADTVSGMLVAVVRDAPALLTDAPYELARLVHRCLEKDPARRPDDIARLADELAPFAGPHGVELAARVRRALEAPSERPSAIDDASVATSVAPVALPSCAPPGPDSEPPHRAETTRPSRRVLAREHPRGRPRSRARTIALLGAAGAIALAALAMAPWLRPAVRVVAASGAQPAIAARAADAPPPVAAAIENQAPFLLPAAVATSELPTPPVSFAAAASSTMTPTPLPISPPPPYVLPAPTAQPRPSRAPTPYRLPPGLPRTRDALPAPASAPPQHADAR
jgi:serine/threonine protein kinase